jgi:hypothetical protein
MRGVYYKQNSSTNRQHHVMHNMESTRVYHASNNYYYPIYSCPPHYGVCNVIVIVRVGKC